MKRKQFEKGIMQIAQEGAIQIFHEPYSGIEEVIVGVVGVLQFEVLEYRLKSEYGVDIRRRSMPSAVSPPPIRRIISSPPTAAWR